MWYAPERTRNLNGRSTRHLKKVIALALANLPVSAGPGTPHGMRSSFRDWCSETGVAREVAEAALAHVVKNKVEAAYARSDLLDRTREVMEAWAAYLVGERRSAEADPVC